jgi:hypothetical protein
VQSAITHCHRNTCDTHRKLRIVQYLCVCVCPGKNFQIRRTNFEKPRLWWCVTAHAYSYTLLVCEGIYMYIYIAGVRWYMYVYTAGVPCTCIPIYRYCRCVRARVCVCDGTCTHTFPCITIMVATQNVVISLLAYFSQHKYSTQSIFILIDPARFE